MIPLLLHYINNSIMQLIAPKNLQFYEKNDIKYLQYLYASRVELRIKKTFAQRRPDITPLI